MEKDLKKETKLKNKENLKLKKKNDILIKEFLNFLEFEKGDSERTLVGYKRDLSQFLDFFSKDFDEILEEDVIKFVERISEKLKKSSVLRKVSVVKSFYKFCYLNNFVTSDPTCTIKNLKKLDYLNTKNKSENKNEKKDKIFTKEKKSKLKKIYDDIKLGDD